MDIKDPYAVLGVARDATEEQIRKAYKHKALLFHPDKNKSAGAEEKFKKIGGAYAILINKEKRQEYDRKHPQGHTTWSEFEYEYEERSSSRTSTSRSSSSSRTSTSTSTSSSSSSSRTFRPSRWNHRRGSTPPPTTRKRERKSRDEDEGNWWSTSFSPSRPRQYRTQSQSYRNNVQQEQYSSNEPHHRRRNETFEGLNLQLNVLKGVHLMAFNSRTFVQDYCLATLLKPVPFNVLAQTRECIDTGKISAFCIAALNKVEVNENETQVVILAPTQQLVLQIDSMLREIGKFCDKTTIWTMRPEDAVNGAKISAHIIIGTPGTVLDAVRRQRLWMFKVRLLVVDKMDEILTTLKCFTEYSEFIWLVPKKAKKIVFSSTTRSRDFLRSCSWFPEATAIELN